MKEKANKARKARGGAVMEPLASLCVPTLASTHSPQWMEAGDITSGSAKIKALPLVLLAFINVF